MKWESWRETRLAEGKCWGKSHQSVWELEHPRRRLYTLQHSPRQPYQLPNQLEWLDKKRWIHESTTAFRPTVAARASSPKKASRVAAAKRTRWVFMMITKEERNDNERQGNEMTQQRNSFLFLQKLRWERNEL